MRKATKSGTRASIGRTAPPAPSRTHDTWSSLQCVARRIKKLEAELRGYQRDTDKAEKALKLWAVEPLTLERAMAIVNVNHYSMCFPLSEYPREPPISQYEGSRASGPPCRTASSRPSRPGPWPVAMNHGHRHRARWIAHLENRWPTNGPCSARARLKADKFDLQPGGQVLRRGHWHVIVKVNRSAGAVRSVTVLGISRDHRGRDIPTIVRRPRGSPRR